ncbi:hypothetical protein ACWDZ8_43180 [Streptomyces sp. NPDC003233]
MTMDIELITAGQLYRYYLRHVVGGDGRRPARMRIPGQRRGAGQSGVPSVVVMSMWWWAVLFLDRINSAGSESTRLLARAAVSNHLGSMGD